MFTKRRSLSRIFVFCITILALFMSGMGGGPGIAKAPLNATLDYAVVFVSRRIPSGGSVYYSSGGSMPGVQPYSRFEVASPGKLIIREANGTLRTLVDGSNPTASSLNLIDVNAPDVSYDATKIVFAGLPAGNYSSGKVGSPGAWRIYVINVDGTGLRQVTFSDRNISLTQFGGVASSFTRYDDTDPAWLPDGRIVFSSTRWPSFAMYGAALTSNLFVVNADGSNLHRITAERNGAERPIIDPLTGKIVYSRWWRNFRLGTNNMTTVAAPEGGYAVKDGLCALSHRGKECQEVGGTANTERNAWHLATINPDGTGLSQFAGRSNSFVVGELLNHAYGGSFAADGSFYANFFPMTNGTEASGFGGIRLFRRGAFGSTPIIGITTRDESVLQFVSTNPKSYGVYVGNYVADPAVLPDGRLVISWAKDTKQDYGLYMINADGSGLTLVYDNPGTTELRSRLVRPRPVPPIIPDKVTRVASALPPTAAGPYDIDGTFTFNALNVYFNAPVDAPIINAPPVGSANSIRFFIDHQRNQQGGSFETLDWPILLKEVPINPNGSVSTSSPANVPLFEQLRTSQGSGYTVPLTGPGLESYETPGASHVAGENFGRTGEVQSCVGCHAGHTLIPVPSNPADAQWTNLATGATVTVSSGSTRSGINDRRVKMVLQYDNFEKYWVSGSGSPTSQWVKLTFPVPVTVRTVRLYGIPSSDSSIRVLGTTVRLYSDAAGTTQVASNTSGALSENGTDIAFSDVRARVVRVEFTSVNGTAAGLGEVEVIARAEADGVASDSMPPAGITNLAATTGTTTGTVNLTWTAPGDDNNTGMAASYLVRYSTSAISNETAWNAATPVTSGVPTPSAAGSAQNMTVSGLTPGTTYFFAVRAQDEVPNLGALSNSPSAAAQSATPLGTGKYDDMHGNWAYTGTWTAYNGAGPYSNTSHYSNSVGSAAQITIDGSKFTLTYVKASNRGSIDVYVDGTKIATINAYSAATSWQQSWTSPVLSAGVHTLRFVHAGGGTYIDIDAIQVYAPSAPVGSGLYDDTDTNWAYTGTWTAYNGAGPYSNTSHYSNSVGSAVQITIDGSKFTLTYVKASNRGSIDVYVDGTKIATINAYSAATSWQQSWTSPVLSAGVHTLRFVHAGGGTYIDIDAIQIQ